MAGVVRNERHTLDGAEAARDLHLAEPRLGGEVNSRGKTAEANERFKQRVLESCSRRGTGLSSPARQALGPAAAHGFVAARADVVPRHQLRLNRTDEADADHSIRSVIVSVAMPSSSVFTTRVRVALGVASTVTWIGGGAALCDGAWT